LRLVLCYGKPKHAISHRVKATHLYRASTSLGDW
jgi:hypothetical protein